MCLSVPKVSSGDLPWAVDGVEHVRDGSAGSLEVDLRHLWLPCVFDHRRWTAPTMGESRVAQWNAK